MTATKLYKTKKVAQQAARRQQLENHEYRLRMTEDKGSWYIELLNSPAPQQAAPADADTAPAAQDIADATATLAEAQAEAPAEAKSAKAKAAPKKDAPAAETLEEAATIFAVSKPNSTHCRKVEAAHNGQMPEEPDLSALTHAYYRRHMERIKEAISLGSIDRLEEITAAIEPKCSSRKPIRAYGLLAAIAMGAQATAA